MSQVGLTVALPCGPSLSPVQVKSWQRKENGMEKVPGKYGVTLSVLEPGMKKRNAKEVEESPIRWLRNFLAVQSAHIHIK